MDITEEYLMKYILAAESKDKAQRHASALEDENEALRADLQIVTDHREQALNNAMALMKQRDEITAAAELACGLLWMIEDRRDKVLAAFHALRDALGGPSSKGLGRAIQRAIDAGYEADHPQGCDWWAGKK